MPKGDAERRTLVLRSGLDLCLLALLEGQTIYGYELTRRLAEHGLPVADGSSYPLLGRLERQGLVTTELRPSTAGPPRKYYSLSDQGRLTLSAERAEWLATTEAMSALLRPPATSGAPEDDQTSVTSTESRTETQLTTTRDAR